MLKKLEVYTTILKGTTGDYCTDFKVGNIRLADHLGVKDEVSSIEVDSKYAKQLLLQEPSDLKSKRVPLYVCNCCADLSCGTLTVKVERTMGFYIWSDFRRESDYEDGWCQSQYMERTGPFEFDKENYTSIIQPYTSRFLRKLK